VNIILWLKYLIFPACQKVGVMKNLLIQSLNFKASQNDKNYFDIIGGGALQIKGKHRNEYDTVTVGSDGAFSLAVLHALRNM
jgi:hypothetical protein